MISAGSNLKLKIYDVIINNAIIGRIFHNMLLYPEVQAKALSEKWVRENYPDYSDAVIKRRTQSLMNWCYEIISYIKW